MLNEALIWNKFYQDIIPSEYWNYKLQEEWAKEAMAFYIAYNELRVLDLDKIGQPYVFTKKDVADKLELVLGYHGKDFTISPNHDGGLTAIYMGVENSLIMTVELTKNYTLIVEYICGGISSKTVYAQEIDFTFKEKEVQRLFTRLFYEWF